MTRPLPEMHARALPRAAGAAAVAVVIVTYDSAQDLPACLPSLARAADGRELDVLVVDNASRDGSAEVARSLAVKVLENPVNQGYARAINRGARLTAAPWLLVANPDITLAPTALARLLDTAAADPGIGCVGPHLVNPDGSDYPTGRRFPSILVGALHALLGTVWPGNPATRRYHMTGVDRSVPIQVDWVSGACMLLRRAAFDQVGGFDEGYFMYNEDMDLCLQLGRAGWRVVFDPGALVVHRVGGSTRHAPYRKVLNHHRSAFRFFRRRYRRDPRILLAPLVAGFLLTRALASLARTWLERRAARRASPASP
jgi:N-acetylglucosaminyl-diphospho-decaprenol L-rhamnosyltransferase